MITKGIIRSKNTDNTYNVYMPYFSMAGQNKETLCKATLSYTPGINNSYDVDDVVFIGFEDRQIGRPIILGKLQLEEEDNNRGNANVSTLNVTNSVNLPLNTKIGGYDLKYLLDSSGSGSQDGGSTPIIPDNIATKEDLENYVDLTSDQQISGNKTLLNKAIKFADTAGNGMSIGAENSSRLKVTNNNNAVVLYLQTNGLFSPNNMTLGTANNKFNNLYLGGKLINGSSSIAVADIASKSQLASYVDLTTDQTIEGKKTFTNVPEVAVTRTVVPEGSGLPEEYQEIEYLQSTGTQYIDSQYFPVSSDTITIKLAPQELSADKAFFGCYGGGFTCELGQMGAGYYRGNVGATSEAAKFTVDETNELIMYNGVWHKGNIAFGAANSGTSTIPAYIFGRNYNSANKLSKVKLFSLKVHRNGELYRNFVPCYRIADNVPGLYETVTGEFHTSVTNNNFILGDNVDREDQSYDVTDIFTLPILECIRGYDITKRQTLKNVYGTFMWVDD